MSAGQSTKTGIATTAHVSSGSDPLTWRIGDGPESEIVVYASGEETSLRCTIAEHRWPAGSEGGLHTHLLEDEGFYVLEGTVTFTMPDDHVNYTASTGDFVWHPSRRRHGYVVSDDGPARVLQILLPGTRLMPDFFRELEGERGSSLTDPSALMEMLHMAKDQYGVVFDLPGVSGSPPRHPSTNGPGSQDGRPEHSTVVTNGPFHSKGEFKLPLLLDAASPATNYAIFHAFGRQTGNVFSLTEMHWPSGKDADSRVFVHTHSFEDEGFYILEGEFSWSYVTEEGVVTRVLGPGDLAWGPRLVPHAGQVGPNGVKFLAIGVPGGNLTDYFYRYCLSGLALSQPDSAEEFVRLNAEHGLYWMRHLTPGE